MEGVTIKTFNTTFFDSFQLHQNFNLIESNRFESYLSRQSVETTICYG